MIVDAPETFRESGRRFGTTRPAGVTELEMRHLLNALCIRSIGSTPTEM